MAKMDKDKFMKLAERAYDTYEIKKEQIFLFKLFQFEFSYDEQNRTCTITCPVTDLMINPSGLVHGGVLCFLADTAMGHTNFRFKEDPYVTLEMKTSFIKAAASGKLIATARYVKEGYNVSHMECEIKNEKGELLCKTSGTFYRYARKK